MADKYELQHFGSCPRVFCNQARVLPVGCNDIPGQETVKLFCPSCLDVYVPPNSRFQSVDGAFFGTTFGCLFFMTFPEFDVSAKGDPLGLAATNPIFGLPAGGITAAEASKSASSSLTSTPVYLSTNPDLPPEILTPLPNQPTMINGATTTNIAPGLGPGKVHEPRIYGFRVSERAKTGPRMKWLRMRPADMHELDETAAWHELYGGDSDDGGPEDSKGPTAYEQQQVARRKKAPIRSRRRPVQTGGEADVGMNGMGEVG